MNLAVQDHIYINPYLTRAEAEVAYQLRLQRRRRTADEGHGSAVTSADTSEQSINSGVSAVLSPPVTAVPDSGPPSGRHDKQWLPFSTGCATATWQPLRSLI